MIGVCKGCFLSIIDVTNRFIDTVCRKAVENAAGVPESDQGGQKLNNEKLQRIRDHLLSLPAYESHYARKKTSKKFLPSHFTIEIAHNEYQKTHPAVKVSRWSRYGA